MSRLSKLIVAGGRGQSEPPELLTGKNGQGRFLTKQDGKQVGKRCGGCGTVKHYDDIGKNSSNADGKRSYCKECDVERMRELRQDEEYRERQREYSREYLRERMQDEEFRERKREIMKKANRKRRQDEEFRERERERQREYMRERRQDEEYLKCEREYQWERRNNPETRYSELERHRLQSARRRARKRILPDTLTPEQVEATEQYFDGCALTQSTESNQLEHFIPLSIGHGGTTAGNCYPMTSTLNYSKNARNPFEWFEECKDIYELDRNRFDNLVEYLAIQNGMTVEEYRDFVYWCFDNPRTGDDIKADNRTSVELYREAKRQESAVTI